MRSIAVAFLFILACIITHVFGAELEKPSNYAGKADSGGKAETSVNDYASTTGEVVPASETPTKDDSSSSSKEIVEEFTTSKKEEPNNRLGVSPAVLPLITIEPITTSEIRLLPLEEGSSAIDIHEPPQSMGFKSTSPGIVEHLDMLFGSALNDNGNGALTKGSINKNKWPPAAPSLSDPEYHEFIRKLTDSMATMIFPSISSSKNDFTLAEFFDSLSKKPVIGESMKQPVLELQMGQSVLKTTTKQNSNSEAQHSLIPTTKPTPVMSNTRATTTPTVTATTTRRSKLQEVIAKIRVSLNASKSGCPSLEDFIADSKLAWEQLKAANGIQSGLGVVVQIASDSVKAAARCIGSMFTGVDRWLHGWKFTSGENPKLKVKTVDDSVELDSEGLSERISVKGVQSDTDNVEKRDRGNDEIEYNN